MKTKRFSGSAKLRTINKNLPDNEVTKEERQTERKIATKIATHIAQCVRSWGTVYKKSNWMVDVCEYTNTSHVLPSDIKFMFKSVIYDSAALVIEFIL